MMMQIKKTVLAACLGMLAGTSSAADLKDNEWYARLTVNNAAENLNDSSNLLGQLNDSVNGYDGHDLVELSPFAAPYLTLVFAHPEWEDNAGDYATDYHAVKGRRHVWRFEVRTDKADRDITLSWSLNNAPDRKKMWLVDGDTGAVLMSYTASTRRPAASEYQFNMNGQTSRTFYWVMGSKKLAQSQVTEEQ